MKRYCLLFLTLTLLQTAFAGIFRVNNTLTTDASQRLFKTIQEANDASAVLAGDTLMIESSPTIYASANINKPLTLIGPGYFLSQNPQTQANVVQAVVSQIDIKPAATGTVLMGLTFSGNNTFFAPYIEASNVIVRRCYLPNYLYLAGNVNNVSILQNFFASSAAVSYNNSFYTFSNVVLKNNVFSGAINIPSDINTQRVFSAVENNIFLGSVTLTAGTFRSNIVVGTSATVNVSSANIENNLVSNNQLPATNGNQTYNAANLFVGATGASTDGQYKLKNGSPYLTAGYNNTEPGIYGGTQPYVLSGIPPLPSIYSFIADGTASKQTGLPINVKAKTNQ
jgi:protein involved in ribonucleotide reduction